MRIPNRIVAIIALLTVLAFPAALRAQDPSPQRPIPKPQTRRAPQKPAAEGAENTDLAATIQTPEEQMRRAVADLAGQINILTTEMRKLRQETRRNADSLQLLLYEERLARVEDKIGAAVDAKAQLDAREQDIQRRSRNIQGELILRGGLRRDEAEAALRAEFQRALDDIHSQQATQQQRQNDLQSEASRLRSRIEALRKRLEPNEEQPEKQF